MKAELDRHVLKKNPKLQNLMKIRPVGLSCSKRRRTNGQVWRS